LNNDFIENAIGKEIAKFVNEEKQWFWVWSTLFCNKDTKWPSINDVTNFQRGRAFSALIILFMIYFDTSRNVSSNMMMNLFATKSNAIKMILYPKVIRIHKNLVIYDMYSVIYWFPESMSYFTCKERLLLKWVRGHPSQTTVYMCLLVFILLIFLLAITPSMFLERHWTPWSGIFP